MHPYDILKKYTFIKEKILYFLSNEKIQRWNTCISIVSAFIALIAVVAAIISASSAVGTLKLASTQFDAITKPQATLESKLATIQSNQEIQSNIKATEDKALRQPEIQMRVVLGESPDLKTDNDVIYLNRNNISFTGVLPTPYMNLLLEQDSTYPNKRYLFIIFINRGEERAESVKIDNLTWTPKQGDPPEGLGDFPKVYESLEVNNAYALLVDAFDFTFTYNFTYNGISNLTHFQDVCAYFTYTNFMGELLTYPGKPCISDVIDLPLVSFPIK